MERIFGRRWVNFRAGVQYAAPPLVKKKTAEAPNRMWMRMPMWRQLVRHPVLKKLAAANARKSKAAR